MKYSIEGAVIDEPLPVNTMWADMDLRTGKAVLLVTDEEWRR